MANPDFAFIDGFDHYTDKSADATISVQTAILTEWNSAPSPDGTGTYIITDPVSGPTNGYALRQQCNTNSNDLVWIQKTMPGNYARCLGGISIKGITATMLNAKDGVTFFDGGTAQLSIGVNTTTGQITVMRGGLNGTVIATSTETSTFGVAYVLEWDITFHNSTGIIKVWLNGALCTNLNLTGQDTCATANNYANGFGLAMLLGPSNGTFIVAKDHLYTYWYTASGGSETPLLYAPVIETTFPNSDHAVAFSVGPSIVGTDWRTTTTTDAPGAGQLALRPFTPEANCTLQSIGLTPGATSASAKFKAVLYADSAGAPAGLTATGTEVTGCTSGTIATLPFSSGQSLTGGTQYWLGYITDTSVAIQTIDTTTNNGQRKTNTYASGAPNPAGTMTATGRPSWLMWGNVTGAGKNYSQVNKRLPTTREYNYESTVGDEDYFGFPALSITPTAIALVALRMSAYKSDGGARTVNLRMDSSGSTSSGTNSGVSPGLTQGYISSNYFTDPATSSAWSASGLNNAYSGYGIAS